MGQLTQNKSKERLNLVHMLIPMGIEPIYLGSQDLRHYNRAMLAAWLQLKTYLRPSHTTKIFTKIFLKKSL